MTYGKSQSDRNIKLKESNDERYLQIVQRKKKYYKENKEKIDQKQKELKIERETFEINEKFAKPWEDLESLFCDTAFLERSTDEGGFGIKIRKSDKCK